MRYECKPDLAQLYGMCVRVALVYATKTCGNFVTNNAEDTVRFKKDGSAEKMYFEPARAYLTCFDPSGKILQFRILSRGMSMNAPYWRTDAGDASVLYELQTGKWTQGKPAP